MRNLEPKRCFVCSLLDGSLDPDDYSVVEVFCAEAERSVLNNAISTELSATTAQFRCSLVSTLRKHNADDVLCNMLPEGVLLCRRRSCFYRAHQTNVVLRAKDSKNSKTECRACGAEKKVSSLKRVSLLVARAFNLLTGEMVFSSPESATWCVDCHNHLHQGKGSAVNRWRKIYDDFDDGRWGVVRNIYCYRLLTQKLYDMHRDALKRNDLSKQQRDNFRILTSHVHWMLTSTLYFTTPELCAVFNEIRQAWSLDVVTHPASVQRLMEAPLKELANPLLKFFETLRSTGATSGDNREESVRKSLSSQLLGGSLSDAVSLPSGSTLSLSLKRDGRESIYIGPFYDPSGAVRDAVLQWRREVRSRESAGVMQVATMADESAAAGAGPRPAADVIQEIVAAFAPALADFCK